MNGRIVPAKKTSRIEIKDIVVETMSTVRSAMREGIEFGSSCGLYSFVAGGDDDDASLSLDPFFFCADRF